MVLACPFPRPKLLRTENTGGVDAFSLLSAAFPPGKGERGGGAPPVRFRHIGADSRQLKKGEI